MSYNGTKTRTWNKSTPADGDLIDDEIDRIYEDLNYLNGPLDNYFIFASLEKILPSQTKPFLDITVDHASLALANWSQLVPFLRASKMEINSVSQFDVIAATKYDANSTVELELSGTEATTLLESLLEDLLYDTDSAAVNGALVDNWGFVVKAVTDIGDGTGKISAGTEMYVKFTNSDILNTLNSVSLKLGVQYSGGSNPIGTISGAKIEIYPFRRDISGGVSSATTARWRRVDDSVLRSGITGLRVRDRMQGHYHSIYSQYPGVETNQIMLDRGSDMQGSPEFLVGSQTPNSSPGYIEIHGPVTDGTNGDPPTGIRTRDRSLGVKLYLNAKEYNP